jgi:hypothetical protein
MTAWVSSFYVDPPKKPPPVGHLTDREWRRRAARTLYHGEKRTREEGWGDLFRFRGGRFAFSRKWADWSLSRKRGRMGEELP